MTGHVDTERILDAFLAPEHDQLADRVLEASFAAIARTPQRRASRVPWRFPLMPALTRTTSLAAVALVAAVGVGGLYLVSNGPGGPGSGSTVPPTPEASDATAGWTSITSSVHGFDMLYPVGWSSVPATRTWQSTDQFPTDDPVYADLFVSPEQGDEQLALLVWEMPPGEGADLESYPGLKALAERFCSDVGLYGGVDESPSCKGFADDAEVMCLDPCKSAILVPTARMQFAFFEDDVSRLIGPTVVRVMVVARPDTFPGATRYGGSVALLKAVLTSMGVWAVGQSPTP